MGGRYRDDDRRLANPDEPDPVAERHGKHVVARRCRGRKPIQHCLGVGVRRVLQGHDLTGYGGVMVAHQSDEGRHSAGARVADRREMYANVQRALVEPGQQVHRWSPPDIWSSTWSSRGMSTSRPCRTPAGEPGARNRTRSRSAAGSPRRSFGRSWRWCIRSNWRSALTWLRSRKERSHQVPSALYGRGDHSSAFSHAC